MRPIILIMILLSILIPPASGLSFSFEDFNQTDFKIDFENSYAENNCIQLTTNASSNSFGRATYYELLQLWDEAKGMEAQFSTHFSFVIDSKRSNLYGDGFAFFLAPQDTLPGEILGGGTLGLTKDKQELNKTANRFFAVEFDTFSNVYDPKGEHVGIDIDSLQSDITVPWSTHVDLGELTDVVVSYDPSTHNLTVGFAVSNDLGVMKYFSEWVDLRAHLPERVTFGFSAACGYATSFQSVCSWNFSSTLRVVNNVTAAPAPAPASAQAPAPAPAPAPQPMSLSKPGSDRSRKGGNRTALLLAIAVGCGVFSLIVVGLFIFTLVKNKKKRVPVKEGEPRAVAHEQGFDEEFDRVTGPRKFSYHDLALATNNFHDEEKLGEGAFGAVYKGFLRDTKIYIAVKRFSRGSGQGMKGYGVEVKIISQLRHRNLVQLIGWCHDKDDLLIVYDYMHNGSLDSHLFQGNGILEWGVRYKIAQGMASGLHYLHEGWEQCVVHRDIKSSNVLLDSNFNAKLGDFGLARLVDHTKGWQTTDLAGTTGYLAPECVIAGKASKESDVYSFGVVLLEIASGRHCIFSDPNEGPVHIVKWASDLYAEGKLLEVADPKLGGDFDWKQMECLIVVGIWCAQPDENSRPSSRQLFQVLNFEAPLPSLPSKMPFASPYPFPPAASTTNSDAGPNRYRLWKTV